MGERETAERETALASIETIHDVLIRTTRYTHVSALGLLLASGTAVAATALGFAQQVTPTASPTSFLALWGCAFLVALAAGVWTSSRKARRFGERLWDRKLQFIIVRLVPALVLGAVLTTALWEIGRLDLAPGIWLGLYGLGILSVSTVLDWEYQLSGWAFVFLSAVALFLLRDHAWAALSIGFGGLHLSLGLYRLSKELAWQRIPRSPSSKS